MNGAGASGVPAVRRGAVWTMEARGDACLVRIAGRLGREDLRCLDADLERAADVGTRFVLDLKGVAHVDYRGLALLSRRAERLANRGGALALCRTSRYIRAIVDLGSAPGALDVHEREEDAWASVGARAS